MSKQDSPQAATDLPETVDPPAEIEGLDSDPKEELSWDEKARQLMRQILTQKVDLPISRISQMIDEGEIDLAPEFQRRLRWNRSQQSRLIESVIMNVPIPPVFLGEDEPGKYVVLDGRQRLTALHEYLNNRFRLSGLDVWKELNGKRFRQLHEIGSPPVASAITRRFIPAVLILHESVPEVKYEVFDRLNTGGVIAEPMEVRNAVYRGPFNRLLHELSKRESFRRLWGIPLDDKQRLRSGSYRRMADLEMALRFFAFQNYEAFAGSVKSFLNDQMAERNVQYEKEPEMAQQDRELFNATMDRTLEMLGEDALHRMDAEKRSDFPSAPLADAVFYTMSHLPEELQAPKFGPSIRKAIDELCLNDEEFLKSITVGTNARTSAEYRIEKALEAVLALHK